MLNTEGLFSLMSHIFPNAKKLIQEIPVLYK